VVENNILQWKHSPPEQFVKKLRDVCPMHSGLEE
jgi:hypothetical protein